MIPVTFDVQPRPENFTRAEWGGKVVSAISEAVSLANDEAHADYPRIRSDGDLITHAQQLADERYSTHAALISDPAAFKSRFWQTYCETYMYIVSIIDDANKNED